MAFTRDMDNTTPINHTLNNTWPSEIRSVKNDVMDRLGGIISGFVSGETVKGILALPFKAVSKPSTIAAQIQLYGKSVSGKTELHAEDEDGNEIQITSAGSINGLTAANLMSLVGPLIYPVGSYYCNDSVSTNPATLLGFGTWSAVAGRVLVGLDAGQTEFDTAGEEGGEKTHTLTASEMPSHVHTQNGIVYGRASNGSDPYALARSGDGGSAWSQNTGSAGSDAAHNNLQPYRTVYMWRRTA